MLSKKCWLCGYKSGKLGLCEHMVFVKQYSLFWYDYSQNQIHRIFTFTWMFGMLLKRWSSISGATRNSPYIYMHSKAELVISSDTD